MSEEVKNNEFSFENPEYRKTYWHTCSHVLAQAMKRLHPEVTNPLHLALPVSTLSHSPEIRRIKKHAEKWSEATSINQKRNTPLPVSYTHLDVYKRQFFRREVGIW